MLNPRTWQDSFDQLETRRRKVRPIRNTEAQQSCDADTGFDNAAKAEKRRKPQLVHDRKAGLVAPTTASVKSAAKPKSAKKSANAKRRNSVKKPNKALSSKKQSAASPSATVKELPKLTMPPVALTAAAAAAAPQRSDDNEAYWLYATPSPLPKSNSLTLYRKPGLFGLLGTWFRLTFSGAKPYKHKRVTRTGQHKVAMPPSASVAFTAMAELRSENERLRRQLDVLMAKEG